jgi:hypothetical protein
VEPVLRQQRELQARWEQRLQVPESRLRRELPEWVLGPQMRRARAGQQELQQRPQPERQGLPKA